MDHRHAFDEPSTWADMLADPLVHRLTAVLRDTAPGQRLPSERDLARSLGVSRTALRDRLRLLESAGVLRRRSGSGTYAQPVSAEALSQTLGVAVLLTQLSAESFLPVLGALDRLAARQAARSADRRLVVRLTLELRGMRTAEPDRAMAAHGRFHDVLADASGNETTGFLRAGLLGVLARSGALWPERGGPEPLDCLPAGADPAELYRRHRRICRAVADRDPTAADAAFTEAGGDAGHHRDARRGSDARRDGDAGSADRGTGAAAGRAVGQ